LTLTTIAEELQVAALRAPLARVPAGEAIPPSFVRRAPPWAVALSVNK
jgi:hypothetical protein